MRSVEQHLAAMICVEARRKTSLGFFMTHDFITNLAVFLMNYPLNKDLDFFVQKDMSFSWDYNGDSVIHVIDIRRSGSYHFTRIDLVGLPDPGTQSEPEDVTKLKRRISENE